LAQEEKGKEAADLRCRRGKKKKGKVPERVARICGKGERRAPLCKKKKKEGGPYRVGDFPPPLEGEGERKKFYHPRKEKKKKWRGTRR